MEIKKLFNGNSEYYIIRIEPGEPLVASLKKFANDTQIGFAWINIIGGGFSDTEYSFSVGFEKGYITKTTKEKLELLNAVGCLAWNHDNPNEPVIHLHASFIDSKLEKAFGGHLVETKNVGLTAEVLITPLSKNKILREKDERVNVNLLKLPKYPGENLEYRENSTVGLKDLNIGTKFTIFSSIIFGLINLLFMILFIMNRAEKIKK